MQFFCAKSALSCLKVYNTLTQVSLVCYCIRYVLLFFSLLLLALVELFVLILLRLCMLFSVCSLLHQPAMGQKMKISLWLQSCVFTCK